MVRGYDIETSLTLDYRKNMWGIERIVLDGVSNHLPADSNGTKTLVRLKQDGQFVDLKEADPDKKTEEVVFEDNGSGYDAGLLSVLFSPKAADVMSVGQFGEGLKLVACAALRNDLNIEYRSRNWTAKPYPLKARIGGHDVEKLCFRIRENGDQLEGSRTVFENPSPELVAKVLLIPKRVLAFNESFRELYTEKGKAKTGLGNIGDFYLGGSFDEVGRKSGKYPSRVIDLGEGEERGIFVKGVKVQGGNAIFSYDLGLEDITPDRAYANRGKMISEIESLLKGCSSKEVVGRVLETAVEQKREGFLEFEAFRDKTERDAFNRGFTIMEETKRVYSKLDKKFENKLYGLGENLWVKTFKELYGEDAVIASHNVAINKDVELMGFRPINIQDSVGKYLRRNGIKGASDIENCKEYRWVNDSDLTDEERRVLARAPEIVENAFGERRELDVRVYSGMFMQTGREVQSGLGVYIKEKDGSSYIGIKRDQLSELGKFASTLVHEAGHDITGAEDYSRRFTDIFVENLARKALEDLEEA